jgi:hypothetical protein
MLEKVSSPKPASSRECLISIVFASDVGFASS